MAHESNIMTHTFSIITHTVLTPGLLQKNSKQKKCNNPGIFPGLVVCLGVFFRNSPEVSTVYSRDP